MEKSSISSRVRVLKGEELNYPFQGSLPYFTVKGDDDQSWGTNLYVNPFPCYGHDRDKVMKLVKKVEAAFPLPLNTLYFLPEFECESRTNGYADKIYTWEDEKRTFQPFVVLHGKRIPIHPAMTRYLIAHEFGHVVDFFICQKRGYKDEVTTEFDREYAKFRGIECNNAYGARRWHTNIGEIIANDFRILMCGVDKDFWQHPHVAHPKLVPNLLAYWQDLKLECSA